MASEPDTDGLNDEQLADIARLADGTLPAERRAEVEANVAASPKLSRVLDAQSVTLEALRQNAAETGAPALLRARIERRRRRTTRRRSPRLMPSRVALVLSAAAVAAALIL